ncbi:MAG: hypothetical protein HY582_03995 [Candidatus Omnitrophica bacterium]|nr:hypothetical protein [Candidatus Omnitrophota bacterium]
MIKQIKALGWVAVFIFLASGCASLKPKHLEYPVHVYEQPFDLVYLRMYETLDANNDWIPYRTDKAKGVIEFRSLKYANIFDLDKQNAYFIVKMVDRKHTSVEIDPSQSTCKDNSCFELLKSVHTVLSELPKRKEKTQGSEEEPQNKDATTPPAQ